MATFVYYLGIALLFTHELDAVRNAEWELLFGLRDLSERTAYPLFVVLHVPLFMAFFWFGHHPDARIREGFRAIAAIGLMAHAAIHFRLMGTWGYGFGGDDAEGWLSNGLIFGAALAGAVYIVLLATRGRGNG